MPRNDLGVSNLLITNRGSLIVPVALTQTKIVKQDFDNFVPACGSNTMECEPKI